MNDEAIEEAAKEVYARFGLSMYCAQVLEHGIVNALLVLELIPARRHRVRTAAEWRAVVDDYTDRHFRRTMGRLLEVLRSVAQLPEAQSEELLEALRLRNWLAHAFFRDYAAHFFTSTGRQLMIAKVDECRGVFESAGAALEQLIAPIRQAHGITDEHLAAAFELVKMGHWPDEHGRFGP